MDVGKNASNKNPKEQSKPISTSSDSGWRRERFRNSSSLPLLKSEKKNAKVSLRSDVARMHALLSHTEEVKPRAIVHLDADCFYAAVERKRLSVPDDDPLAVQQWSNLIAVDYISRKFGVKRGMNAEEAKKICPNLRCVHVELIGDANKVSLKRYRDASFKVLEVFSRFVREKDVLCRASIDEAYLDLTESCIKQLKVRPLKVEDDVEKYTCIVGSLDRSSPFDQMLICAASIVRDIRVAVMNELGYSISAGIAGNKLLAKVASSRNKPYKQTIVPFRFGPQVLGPLPIRGIPGLGGKLGVRVEKFVSEFTNCSTGEREMLISDLQLVPETKLWENFSQDTARWLHRVAYSLDDSPVKPRDKPKSILAMKSFSPIRIESELFPWIKVLAEEIAERCDKDERMFSRRPRTLVLHHRGVHSNNKRNQNLNRRLPGRTIQAPLKLKRKYKNKSQNSTPKDSSKQVGGVDSPFGEGRSMVEDIITLAQDLFRRIPNALPCSRIGLCLTDFADLSKKPKIDFFNSTRSINKKVTKLNADNSFDDVSKDSSSEIDKGKIQNFFEKPKVDKEIEKMGFKTKYSTNSTKTKTNIFFSSRFARDSVKRHKHFDPSKEGLENIAEQNGFNLVANSSNLKTVIHNKNNNKWECARCTFHNSVTKCVCEMCGKAINNIVKQSLNPNQWECTSCTFHNKLTKSVCEICGTASLQDPKLMCNDDAKPHSQNLKIDQFFHKK